MEFSFKTKLDNFEVKLLLIKNLQHKVWREGMPSSQTSRWILKGLVNFFHLFEYNFLLLYLFLYINIYVPSTWTKWKLDIHQISRYMNNTWYQYIYMGTSRCTSCHKAIMVMTVRACCIKILTKPQRSGKNLVFPSLL